MLCMEFYVELKKCSVMGGVMGVTKNELHSNYCFSLFSHNSFEMNIIVLNSIHLIHMSSPVFSSKKIWIIRLLMKMQVAAPFF